VSALIHAATMVTAGVFLVARAGVFFALAPVAATTVGIVGALTALFAATIGLKQWDIKKVLAYSTISQLGYMFVGVGAGAYAAGIFHLTTHAFFKALLFLGSGSVIHALHAAYHHTHRHADAQDMRNMGGLSKWLPTTARTMWIATFAIAGVPPLAGFFSKDEILAAAFGRGHDAVVWYAVWFMGVAAAFITAVYMTRLMRYTFHGVSRTGTAEQHHLHPSPRVMTVPLVILAVLTVLGGALNLPEIRTLHHWLEPVARTAVELAGEPHVTSGVEFTLMGLAAVVAAVGITLAWKRLRPENVPTPDQARPETGFVRLLAEKYRVDELYEAVIVRPVVWISRNVFWKVLDAGLVDGAFVNGSAVVSRTLGWIGSRMQTGMVGTYVVVFVIGALAVLGALAR
jgi:NADH-quinone oxidoreductase subunit L